MEFKSRSDLILKTLFLKEIGEGSQGICYLDSSNKLVYKIYHEFFDGCISNRDYSEIMKFSNITNKTYIFPKDIIEINGEVVGYVEPYVTGKDLPAINPLMVNLDKLIKNINDVSIDIETISENGVLTFDVMYNILYKNRFNIIDSDDYTIRDIDPNLLFEMNKNKFDYAIYNFLIDEYFDNFVNDYKELKNMYKNKTCDVTIFICLLRKYLSEYVGDEVNKLNDAKECMNKVRTKSFEYIRKIKMR